MTDVSLGANFARTSDIKDLKTGDVIVAPKAWFGVDNEDDGIYELRDRSYQYKNFSKITDDPQTITRALQADLHLRFKNVIALGGHDLVVYEDPHLSASEGVPSQTQPLTTSWETTVVPLDECGRAEKAHVVTVSQGDRGYAHALHERPTIAVAQDGTRRVMELC